jgi:hypothetical protein
VPRQPEVDRETSLYVQRSCLYGARGLWPMPRNDRVSMYNNDKLRQERRQKSLLSGDWGMIKGPPPPPPANLSEQQAETVNRQISKQGFWLTRGASGAWIVTRLANF